MTVTVGKRQKVKDFEPYLCNTDKQTCSDMCVSAHSLVATVGILGVSTVLITPCVPSGAARQFPELLASMHTVCPFFPHAEMFRRSVRRICPVCCLVLLRLGFKS